MTTDLFTASPEAEERNWCAQVREQLEREANALDAVTAARLSGARHRALAVARDRAPSGATSARWLPWLGGAVAASLLLAVLLGRGSEEVAVTSAAVQSGPVAAQAEQALPLTMLVASDVAVIADLEFYDWLEEQDAVL
ncbi:MAG: hypothetical protein ABIP49_08115 [Lysobacterales bacterium]